MHWYVLHVRASAERRVREKLLGHGLEAFLPLYRRTWSYGYNARVIERPLFPGYVFGRLNLAEHWLPALKITGVIRLLGAESKPEAVPDDEIAAIRRLLESPYPLMNLPDYQIGDKVTIDHGPFAGMDAIVQKLKHRPGLVRIVVSIELLGRSVAVEMDGAELRAAA